MRPLHYAARSGWMTGVCLLLASAADPAAANGDGRTAASLAQHALSVQKVLSEAMEAGVRQHGQCFPSIELVAAAGRGNQGKAAALLSARADPDSSDGQLTALQQAAWHCCVQSIKY